MTRLVPVVLPQTSSPSDADWENAYATWYLLSRAAMMALHQVIMLLIVLWFLKLDGWDLAGFGCRARRRTIFSDIAIGGLAAIVLHYLFIQGIGPILDRLEGVGSLEPTTALTPEELALCGPLPRIPEIVFVMVVSLGPICEELVYRGYALSVLLRRMPGWLAVLVSSLFFGLGHWGQGPWSMAGAAVFGVVISLLFIWRRNLVSLWVAHCLFNLSVYVL